MKMIDTGHVAIDPAILDGVPHIAGHRIAVSHLVVWIVYQGETPEAIAEEFSLTLAEVHAALAYYYDHQQALDEQIAATARLADEMARRYPEGWSPTAEG
jgi:uncharacterized protein (DUF433 family)